MKDRVWFWGISAAIFLFFGALGFALVPNWARTFQTPEQRVEYLCQSIWCPI